MGADLVTQIGDARNSTSLRSTVIDNYDDAAWILTSSFVVFTMQIGFGLLESGSVSVKNEANIMVKNAIDVLFGGLTYWMFGYGLSFGEEEPLTNAVVGWGNFFVQADEENLGWMYAKFFFQASFATTATTIVSGAMAERTKLEAYMLFSLVNTFVYCVPAHWMWGHNGWLQRLGVIDIAGAGPVHLVGGVTGLVATLLLKPRHHRYAPLPTGSDPSTPAPSYAPRMSSPTNAILGMFMLWWGWLGFNCGSTFGISGLKWKLAARSAVATICSSFAGGIVGITMSFLMKRRKFDISFLINGILGSLVAITATCAIVHPWEGLVIGLVGSMITIVSVQVLDKLKVDDPVGCVGTHAMSGAWGLLAVGFFSRRDTLAVELQTENVENGLFHGGGGRLLGLQLLAIVAIVVWTVVTSFLILKAVDFTVGLRIPLHEELLGADLVEHDIGDFRYDKRTRTVTPLPVQSPGFAQLRDVACASSTSGGVHSHSIARGPHSPSPCPHLGDAGRSDRCCNGNAGPSQRRTKRKSRFLRMLRRLRTAGRKSDVRIVHIGPLKEESRRSDVTVTPAESPAPSEEGVGVAGRANEAFEGRQEGQGDEMPSETGQEPVNPASVVTYI